MYIIRKTLIPTFSDDDDETNYVDNYMEMIARAPILERGTIEATDEAVLALQATNGSWDLKSLIDQRVVYFVMQNKLEHTMYVNSLLANASQSLVVLSIGYSKTIS